MIQQLRNPSAHLQEQAEDIDPHDPALLHSIRTFLAHPSEDVYEANQKAYIARHPDEQFYSLYRVKRRISLLTGIEPLIFDMCILAHVAFVAMYADLDTCPECGEARYDPDKFAKTGIKVPRKQFTTIPIGPVIQALYRSEDSAQQMHYFLEHVSKLAQQDSIDSYYDTCCGSEFLKLYRSGYLKHGDVVLQLSIDGAQLFRDKTSDCWLYIFVIHNLSPDLRYKKKYVMPGGFIPGKPSNLDSFLFPGLHHIAALQNEGFAYYDAHLGRVIRDAALYLPLATADSPAMADLSGTVGHTGKHGCRLQCQMPGRHRANDGHYYPAMMKPNDYIMDGCDHDDVTFRDLRQFRDQITQRYEERLEYLCSSPNLTQYNHRRLQTGITKPTIFSGLRYTIGVPNMFVMDLMHLTDLNDPDLLLGLWRGTIKCYGADTKDNWDFKVLVGNIWEGHSHSIVKCIPYIPSSFGRAPRDPSQKINSGYKAAEFELWIYCLGPALLRNILPEDYFLNYCRFVRGVRLGKKYKIQTDKVVEALQRLFEFISDFEQFYYQRNADRLHFIRQSIHLLSHIPAEIVHVGPLPSYSQYTIENLIGNLGREIRSLVKFEENLANRGVLRVEMNCLTAMYPHIILNNSDQYPRGASDLGDGYALLRVRDDTACYEMSNAEADTLRTFWIEQGWPETNFRNNLLRWGRLQLPNGQQVRSVFSESRTTRTDKRRASIAKVSTLGSWSL